jgi:hypothetical protein
VTSFRCEFGKQGENTVGDCVTESSVTNDGGAWKETGGRMTITFAPDGSQLVVSDGVRVGTGDYEGLRFAYHAEGQAHAYPWPITGTIERDS